MAFAMTFAGQKSSKDWGGQEDFLTHLMRWVSFCETISTTRIPPAATDGRTGVLAPGKVMCSDRRELWAKVKQIEIRFCYISIPKNQSSHSPMMGNRCLITSETDSILGSMKPFWEGDLGS